MHTTSWTEANRQYLDRLSTGVPDPADQLGYATLASRQLEAERLDALEWNEMRRVAKERGVPARGGRAALTAALLEQIPAVD